MSQTERIRYTVTGYNFTEISSGNGSIEYQLTDDFGNERTVTATAKVNLFNKISSVSPIYNRELPLIKALSRAKINESVIVDFSEYNKKYPRGSMRKQKISVPSLGLSSTGLSSIDSFGSLADNKSRLVKLIMFSIVGFGVFSYFLLKFV